MRKLSPSEVQCLTEEPAGVRDGPETPVSKACTLCHRGTMMPFQILAFSGSKNRNIINKISHPSDYLFKWISLFDSKPLKPDNEAFQNLCPLLTGTRVCLLFTGNEDLEGVGNDSETLSKEAPKQTLRNPGNRILLAGMLEKNETENNPVPFI